jgi:putative membrane protein
MKHFIQITAGIALMAAVSCNGGDHKDSVETAKSANDSMTKPASDTGASLSDASHSTTGAVVKEDADFAVEAGNGGMEEVEMGKLAQSNAADQRVKDFGAMMVKDHSAAGDKLKALAQQKNIMLPAALGDKQQKMVADLQKKQGKDFDKAYMDMMLDDHKKDIKEFTKASTDCKDPDLKQFAAATLPTLQKHLDSVRSITGKN